MSAYGPISHSASQIQYPSRWPSKDSAVCLTVYHVTLDTIPKELISLMYEEFDAELERGNTYPQEGPFTKEAFQAYFLGADAFVGMKDDPKKRLIPDLDTFRANRLWEDIWAGGYYIKPNYPGRSSHICNAGFVVSHRLRGFGFGRLLGRSYLHYAPQLGYEASVFNLVYTNNIASIRIWDNLGFTRAGLIPRAGRLKKKEESGEEFVDAIVFYKRFDPVWSKVTDQIYAQTSVAEEEPESPPTSN